MKHSNDVPTVNSDSRSKSEKLILVTHHLPVTCTANSKSSEARKTTQTLQIAQAENSLTYNSQAPSQAHIHPNGNVWTFQQRHGHSALYSGIRSLRESEHEDVLHVGWTGSLFDAEGRPIQVPDPIVRKSLESELGRYQYAPVILEEKVAAAAYEGYCKTGMWTDGMSRSALVTH
jgi:trehalose-6-phosphate synthase